MTDTSVLFILKRREDYNPVTHSPKGLSTGLYNSASFVNDMLVDAAVTSHMEVAIDNNCIDALVTKYKPTHVIIEALWVVPTKFAVLTKLHPNVTWIIRLHSEMPFMAGEGIAMDWVGDYASYPEILIACNAPRMLSEIRDYLRIKHSWRNGEEKDKVIYLPNYYPQTYKSPKKLHKDKFWVDIGCFGAVRPLKNHLLQAFAAMRFADSIGKQLRFHINSGRIEMQGSAAMHNLRDLFSQLHDAGHQLIGHEWRDRPQFLELCAQMDIGMQCNFSETFNIVGADLVSQGVPLIGTSEIPWSSSMFNARATESSEIYRALHLTYLFPQINVWKSQINLTKYTQKTKEIWIKYFRR